MGLRIQETRAQTRTDNVGSNLKLRPEILALFSRNTVNQMTKRNQSISIHIDNQLMLNPHGSTVKENKSKHSKKERTYSI